MSDVEFLPESPSQTAGPYLHIGFTPNHSGIDKVFDEYLGNCLVNDRTLGERITITGCIYDGDNAPVADALVEIWQADAQGIYSSPEDGRADVDPNFNGWGRCATDSDSGEFRFETVRPGSLPYTDGRPQAPHITVWVVARGINVGLHTRLYFEDDPANANDPLLMQIESRERAETLVARHQENGAFRFDIYLQGEHETVFLDM